MNPEDSAQLLSQLRDIHGAPEAPFWPPAPGWWVLAVLVLLALAWTLRRLWRVWARRRRRRALLDHLGALREEHDPREAPQAWLAAVNRLLKVTAMRERQGTAPGVLKGDDWTAFLGGGAPGAFAPLAAGPYQPRPEFDAEALERAAADWIRRHG